MLRSAFCLILLCSGWYLVHLTSRNISTTIGKHEKREVKPDKPPLCQSDAAYNAGAWVYNSSISTYPYLRFDDDEWAPQCTALQRNYREIGEVPAFLQYSWEPQDCSAITLDRADFCRLLGNQTVGMIGDSMMQQFARSLLGRMLGQVDSGKDIVRAPLCGEDTGAHLNFHRWDRYKPDEDSRAKMLQVVETSDIVILNFGVHYTPWLEYEAAMVDLIQLMEANQRHAQKYFWRSTIASHADCADATAPETSMPSLHSKYSANKIIQQDVEISQPLLQKSSLDVSILRVDQTTLLRRDGHRVIGHNGVADCLHYCEPGPTDNWVDLLYHHLMLQEKGLQWQNTPLTAQ